jgi:hypothetical protein
VCCLVSSRVVSCRLALLCLAFFCLVLSWLGLCCPYCRVFPCLLLPYVFVACVRLSSCAMRQLHAGISPHPKPGENKYIKPAPSTRPNPSGTENARSGDKDKTVIKQLQTTARQRHTVGPYHGPDTLIAIAQVDLETEKVLEIAFHLSKIIFLIGQK